MRVHFKENIESEDPEYQWQMGRRSWLKTAVLAGIAMQLPWLQSCINTQEETSNEIILDGQGIFKPREMLNIHFLHNIIVPDDGNGPSAADVQSANYFAWMLAQPLHPEKNKNYFINKWVQITELCSDTYSCEIDELNSDQQEEFLLTLTESGWTRSYISKMTSVIFEAMLLDPIYGFNPNGIGWDWLDVYPGQPRANEDTKYPNFLKIIDSQYG